ncbi:hypothetical protein WJX82_007642 [Trebouxia sp. C0006]
MADAQQQVVPEAESPQEPPVAPATPPDYLLEPNAVLLDNCRWRHGQVPDYSKANASFLKGRTTVHAPGSLEEIVSNLVKNWEKEVSYKTHEEDFRTIDSENYQFSVNGGIKRGLTEMLVIGTYSALIGDQALFCSSKISFEESHKTFRRSLAEGYSWEVLEVWSGPPKVAFKWRHWGKMTGPLTCPLHNGLRMVAQPTNEVVSLTGVAFCTLSDKFQIQNLEVYFDQNEPMNSMVKINNSPIGLPAKGKTAGGVDVELKPPGPQASPERKKAINRGDSTASSVAEARKPEPQKPLEKQFSSPDQQEGGTGIWGGIWGWWDS